MTGPHLSEDELVLHYYGEEDSDANGPARRHLDDCAECRRLYRALQQVLNAVDAAPVPERPADYGTQVWARVAPLLPRGSRRFALRRWLAQAPRWVLACAATLALTIAFLAGRNWPDSTVEVAGSARPIPAAGRERILRVAVGDHLERSHRMLAEFQNGPVDEAGISAEQEWAEDLLDANRLYRQTATARGEAGVASVLEELERVLLEVAHASARPSEQELGDLRQRIQEQELLFKVRMLGSQVREQARPARLPGESL